MKKILLFASALAGLFLAGCQRENLEPVQAGQQVTFTIEAPAAMQTKAIADGQNVDQLVYEVWLTPELGNLSEVAKAQKLYQATTEMVSDGTTNKAELTLDLVNDQKFTVLFWAQVAHTYDTDELTAVGYKKLDDLKANDESLAAFYGVAYVDDCRHVKLTGGSASAQVILKRPFAQLNLCTLNTSTAYVVDMVESEVIVENVPTVFNVVNGVEDVNSYAKVTFDMAAVPSDPATITVNNKEYQYAGMNYMFAGDNITLEYNIKTSLNGQSEAVVNNIISDVPLKENYRTNIVGNLLTSKIDYEIIVDANFNIPDELVGEGTVLAKTSEDFVNALKRNEAHLVIDLVGTQTKAMTPVEFQVPIGAWTEKYYFGGDKTRTITINANGNKINFVHENTDWNYIRMVNDNAKWIINDATLTNSGENDGPWNRHDIRFYNAVELNNVTSDKAIALLYDGELNNVTITEETGAYGLWITADGQKVDINGLNITATNGGRGIAIKDQYVNAPACVTLNVENAKFETAEKAAILVTSTKGAVINWGAGNDIKGVAADPINAVWVDEDYAQYDSEVKVEGASKVVEGAVDNVAASGQDALMDALAAAAKSENTVVVNVVAGTYGTLPAMTGNVVLNCAEGTMFTGTSGLNINGATVIGATFENKDGIAARGTIYGTFKNCTFDGSEALRWCYSNEGKEVVFEDCEIKTDFRGFHFDGMDGNVIFRRCKINGFNAYGGEGTATFENCVFGNDESTYNGLNTYSNTVLTDCQFNFISGKTNFIDMEGTGKTMTINNCTATLDGVAKPVTDFVGGSKLAQNTVILDGKTFVASQAALLKALKSGAKNICLKAGNYELANSTEFVIASDEMVTIEGENKEGCVVKVGAQLRADGKKLTLKNLTTTVPTGLNYTEHTFAWIHHFTQFNMIGCNSDGRIRLNCYNANIEECNFNVTTSSGFDGYAIFYYGPTNSNVTVKDCVFTTVGKAIVMYNEGKPVLNLDVEDCEFTSSAATDKAAIQMHTEYGISGTLDIVNCTATGFADVNGGLFNELNNITKVPTNNFDVTIE